jgi:hypothetical protein
MKDQLTETRAGRIVLHLMCIVRHGRVRWHWDGIRRELIHVI